MNGAEFLVKPVLASGSTDVAVPTPMACSYARHPAQIELQLARGRCLRFGPARDATKLTQLIRAVEGA